MRAAIYARVSSERQEKEHTIGSQLEALRTYAAKNGMEIVEEFTDEGYSGARLDRPALGAWKQARHSILANSFQRPGRRLQVLQCLALTSRQTYGGKVHSSHYYGCLRTTSGFLKQERCSQRRIRADVLGEFVRDEVSTRLQDPVLILEAHQTHQTQRRDSADEDGSSEKDQRLQAQIKLANRELSRLLYAYQGAPR